MIYLMRHRNILFLPHKEQISVGIEAAMSQLQRERNRRGEEYK
jgi:hypothetical protein